MEIAKIIIDNVSGHCQGIELQTADYHIASFEELPSVEQTKVLDALAKAYHFLKSKKS